jgi:hypothetical protein
MAALQKIAKNPEFHSREHLPSTGRAKSVNGANSFLPDS